jgi:hypothetical protein
MKASFRKSMAALKALDSAVHLGTLVLFVAIFAWLTLLSTKRSDSFLNVTTFSTLSVLICGFSLNHNAQIASGHTLQQQQISLQTRVCSGF